jgi:hypothetical protein
VTTLSACSGNLFIKQSNGFPIGRARKAPEPPSVAETKTGGEEPRLCNTSYHFCPFFVFPRPLSLLSRADRVNIFISMRVIGTAKKTSQPGVTHFL